MAKDYLFNVFATSVNLVLAAWPSQNLALLALAVEPKHWPQSATLLRQHRKPAGITTVFQLLDSRSFSHHCFRNANDQGRLVGKTPNLKTLSG